MEIFSTNTTKISNEWIAKNFGVSGKNSIGNEICTILKNKFKKKKKSSKENNNIQNIFLRWKEKFQEIYPKDELNKDLYIKHCLLSITIITILISTFQDVVGKSYFNFNNNNKNKKNNNKNIVFIAKKINKISKILKIPDYFIWIFEIEDILTIILKIFKTIHNIEKDNEDLFSKIYQNLIVNTKRHSKGEFYTHSALAKLMCLDSYKFGMKVLDPACGSGTFLTEIITIIRNYKNKASNIEKIQALNNLYGIDINPIACFMARANLLIFTKFTPLNSVHENIFVDNALFPSKKLKEKAEFIKEFDLIIGNPPWIVLNRIPSEFEKNRIKKLGKDLGIYRGGKFATSTELTTIFIYNSLKEFSRLGSNIFFVTPASLATGSQHALFRQFSGFKDVEFWSFDKDVFRIHNLCFKATVGISDFNSRLNKISWKKFECQINPLEVKLKNTVEFHPSNIKGKIQKDTHLKVKNLKIKPDPDIYIGRLIEKVDSKINQKSDSKINKKINKIEFRNTESPYKTQFRQGASIVPRNLVLIDKIESIKPKKSENSLKLIKIKPSKSIISKKYGTWGFKAFAEEEVEEKYIFQIAKSTGLLPFNYFMKYFVFLPLEKENKGNYKIQTPKEAYARNHYENLENLYDKHKKNGAKIKTLMERLNYGHALTNIQQFKPLKIIYAGIGSIVKAAIIYDKDEDTETKREKEPTIIDTSLYYFSPKSLYEAYYLIGYLNSPILTDHLKLVGSTGINGSLRNIHKHPLNFDLPIFDNENNLHIKISKFAKDIEKYVSEFINKSIEVNPILKNKPKTIKNRLFKNKNYKKKLKLLDILIKKLMINYDK